MTTHLEDPMPTPTARAVVVTDDPGPTEHETVIAVTGLEPVLQADHGYEFTPAHLVVHSRYRGEDRLPPVALVTVTAVGEDPQGDLPLQVWTNRPGMPDGHGLHAIPHPVRAIVLAYRPELRPHL